jgi:hypothetical protein
MKWDLLPAIVQYISIATVSERADYQKQEF